jgi:hypothetical protein
MGANIMEKKTIKAAATKNSKTVKPAIQPKEEKIVMASTTQDKPESKDVTNDVLKLIAAGKIKEAARLNTRDTLDERGKRAAVGTVKITAFCDAIIAKMGFGPDTKAAIHLFVQSHYTEQNEKYIKSRTGSIYSGMKERCKKNGTYNG